MTRVVKKPAERKQELINIAIELFFKNGYEKTSVKDIYTEANGSFGMFYHHFKSKEEIFESAMSNFTDNFIENLTNIILNREIPYAKRYQMAVSHWRNFLINRDKVSDCQHDVAVFRNLSLRMVSGSIEPLELYIEEGIEKGLLRVTDSHQTAVFLIYGIYGLMREERMLLASNENAPKVFISMTKIISDLLKADKDLFALPKPEKEKNVND